MSEYSFEDLCVTLQPELLGHAKRLCKGNLSRAEDIVQDSFIRAMRGWPRWDPGEGDSARAARGWMYRIVSNTFINDYNQRKTRGEVSYEDINDVAAPNAPDANVPGLSDEVQEALGDLSPEFRECVERYYLWDESYKSIADSMDVALGTVMSRLWRARKALAEVLEGYAEAEYGLPCIEYTNSTKPPQMVQAKSDRVNRIMAGDYGGELGIDESLTNLEAAGR